MAHECECVNMTMDGDVTYSHTCVCVCVCVRVSLCAVWLCCPKIVGAENVSWHTNVNV